MDACVLFQGRLTNLLLWLAEARAFEPIWSDAIHEEWSRNLAASKLGMTPEKIAYRKAQMQLAFPVANCDADPAIVLAVQAMCRLVRHKKDAHVVATAIGAKAGTRSVVTIVTENTRDFAPDILAAYRLRKARPENFCLELLNTRPAETLAGLTRHRASMVKTPMDPKGYLAYLDGQIGLRRLSRALAKDLLS